MANLQSFLLPLSATGNSSASQLPNTDYNNDSTPGTSAGEAIAGPTPDAATGFAQLLEHPPQVFAEKTEKSRLLFRSNTNPNSSDLLGGEAFELTEFDGKQFPFWGQILPQEQSIDVTNPAQALVDTDEGEIGPGSAAVEIPGTAVTGLSGSASSSSEVLRAMAESDLHEANYSLESEASENSASAQLNTSMATSEESSSELKLLKNSQMIAQSSVNSGISSAPATELSSKLSIEQGRRSRDGGVEFQSLNDAPSLELDTGIESSKLDSVLVSQNSRSADKASYGSVGVVTANGTWDSSGALNSATGQSTMLTSALSQWRADQDGNAAVNPEAVQGHSQAKLTVPFNQAGWGDNLGRQLSLLLAKNMDSAQIQLDPPELGPLGVKIQINQDQVSLHFTSGHAVVREALEQSSARLQQMFSEEGLELVDVGVEDERQSSNQNPNQHTEDDQSHSASQELALERTLENDSLLTLAKTVSVDDGKIDYFI